MTNANPTVGEIPLDSVTAQIISWSREPPNIEVAVLVPVLGLTVLGRAVPCLEVDEPWPLPVGQLVDVVEYKAEVLLDVMIPRLNQLNGF